MLGKISHLQVVRQQCTQNTANLRLQTYEKISRSFPLYDTGVDFSLRINNANLGSFAKVSVPVGSVIPLLDNLSCKIYLDIEQATLLGKAFELRMKDISQKYGNIFLELSLCKILVKCVSLLAKKKTIPLVN